MCNLYQIFVHVACVRGAVLLLMLTIGRIAYGGKAVTGVYSAGEV